ncbi:MAG: tRNA-dihydrouridine synthase [Candidatus Latescibacteria bacterium]|nr:tRNA dihydrouridine synthase DusB [Gemmatimonadaceae bacterium]MDP6018508.1 tRNA-dihydrouridine synthase [Candidatus Latescibacterota bacterium]MDP7447799.1 tRNA-dihydrouridine synthase [Candidatus Latescibacterota bacterium]HJP29524.1 tRNA-dihydrouridine synthase [Candidatus Latescibacterota bacterium]
MTAPGTDTEDAVPETASGPSFHIGPHALSPLRPGMPVMALAPMAGIGNWVFRLICAQLGARLVGVEFINCRLVQQTGRRMARLLDFSDAEVYRRTGISLLAAQIYGNDIELMARGAAELERRGTQVVDINFGCSVPQIVNKGNCAAWLRDLPRFYDAVQATVEAVNVPVMVKTRIGWDDDSINIIEIVEKAQEAGARAIAIHGRTVLQKYDGEADWSWIRRACDNADVPVFGNGDVRTYDDAVAMAAQTGCDGVMIGRAAMANPWIFSGRLGASLAERIELAAEQVRWMAQYKGERVGVQETRKHLVLYFRDLERNSAERRRLLTTASLGELLEFLEQWRASLQHDEERDLGLSRAEANRLAWGGTG